MPSPTAWDKTKAGSKKGLDKVWALADRLGTPANKISNKLGAEAFWPTTLDEECHKAARVLRSFSNHGYDEKEVSQAQQVVKMIPKEVIHRAKGLAIFTALRTGLWISGSGGSGVLVARVSDGSWSPPSAIMLHTHTLGFTAGVDIYDCVVVINSEDALKGFSTARLTLGGELSVTVGSVGAGAMVDSEVHARQSPSLSYIKSRGVFAGIGVDGTIIVERTDENERFYGEKIGVLDILAGKAQHPPPEIKVLTETVRAAQGDTDVDQSLLPSQPPPGDMFVEKTEQLFGIPNSEDPDPFGVLALEKEGFQIREAGSQSRPSSEQFEYRPSPTSPIFSTFSRRSVDDNNGRSRRSYLRQSVDRGIQTEIVSPSSLEVPHTPGRPTAIDHPTETEKTEDTQTLDSFISITHPRVVEEEEETAPEPVLNGLQGAKVGSPEHHATDEIEGSLQSSTSDSGKRKEQDVGIEEAHVSDASCEDGHLREHPSDDEDGQADDEAVEIHEPAQVAPQVISKARLVTIPKRLPPAVPPRSPARRKLGGAVPSTPNGEEISSKRSSSRSPSTTFTSTDGSSDSLKQPEPSTPNATSSEVNGVTKVEREENGLESAIRLEDHDGSTPDLHGNGIDTFHSIPTTPTDTTPTWI
ncbi:MAG: hypothetical protein M1817_000934 [Caeruleum heppii]|nr:MAG: hypothetical protein M1817_000934 [Caeruleum heppii]